VFGKYHVKEQFVAKTIKKPTDVEAKIRDKLLAAFLFMFLDDKDL